MPADRIVAALGDVSNIAASTHCATRLRIAVVDPAAVDERALAGIDGVLGVARVGEQVQIVVGPRRVASTHEALRELVDAAAATAPAPGEAPVPDAAADGASGRRWLRPVTVVMDVIVPLLPTFVAGGLLLGLHNLLTAPGILGPAAAVEALPGISGIAALIGILGVGVFTLLPVIVGFSAALRFGTSPYLGAAMGAALVVAPFLVDAGVFPALRLDGAGGWTIAGVDVLGIDYRGTVVPMIAVAYVLARVERLWTRLLGGTARYLFVPTLTLLVTGLLAFLVIGPVLGWLGDGLAALLTAAYEATGMIGGALFGALYPLLVVTGTHQSLVSVELGLLGQGGSFIFPVAGAANLAQAGACFAVALLARRRSSMRALAAGAGLPACLGIAEPAIFGITLRLQFPLVAAVIASAAGGAMLAAWNVQAVTLGAAGVLGIASIAPGLGIPYLASVATSAVVAFGLTLGWGRLRRRPIDDGAPGADLRPPAAHPGGLGTLET
ncbi:PTS transporter subunit EIIC [Microbacterium hominis]|uniref:PTS transporter subunit EIIC n=1 Tax=Microbacterium hominis TaxID=162426 RepID=UPI00077CB692|nr:PTS transporter subunit EIIC [Microbacterium hominis]